MSTIRVTGLTKFYGGPVVLDDVDLEVAEGELVGLLGPSGCGKSTLLRCIAGLEQPERGRIEIGERTVTDGERRRFVPPERRNVGVVFQSYALWPHLTVGQNVAYPLKRRKVAAAEIEQRVAAALEQVGLPGLEHRRPGQLSGGQQQRVAIARAVVAEPAVMLFDEPLSNLDANLRRLLRREIRALHERIGTTTLYVTHDQEEIGGLADRVAVLSHGAIAQLGTPRDVFTRPASRRVAEFVGFDNFLPATARSANGSTCVVATPTHELQVASAPGLIPGAPVLLAARSRALSLNAGGAPLAHGEVVALAHLGDSVEVEVRVGEQSLIALLADGETGDVRAGQRVTVTVESDGVVALGDAHP